MTKERFSKGEHLSIEINQSEEQRAKRQKKNEQGLSDKNQKI